jgi:hypothetical protein
MDGKRRLALKSYCLAWRLGRGPGLRSWLLGLQTQSGQALRSVSLVLARHNDQRKYVFLTDEARRTGIILSITLQRTVPFPEICTELVD